MSTINLPARSIKTIVDVDNRQVVVPIERAMESLETSNTKTIRSLFALPNDSTIKVTYHYDMCYINKIVKTPITLFNKSIKYFNLKVKYHTDLVSEFIVPSFVKFYSSTNRAYIPVEFLKKADVLVDTSEHMVQVLSVDEVPDIDLTGEDFYGFSISCANQDYISQFYLNDILTSISYNNYIKE